MMKKILIPTDGSSKSDVVLEYGIYTARKLNAFITGLHVLDAGLLRGQEVADIPGAAGMSSYSAAEKSLSGKADFILDIFLKRCRQAGLEPTVKKIPGKIDEIITGEAGETDFIMMAGKGKSLHLKEGAVIGSITESVVRNSGKPVMIIPADFREIESMAFAYDGSPPAKKALDLSLELSEQAVWPLTAIIAGTDTVKATLLSREIEEAAQAKETDCEVIIMPGKEGEEIIKFIREDAVELMVMGAYGCNSSRKLFLGSTASQIISQSPIPLMLVH